MTVLFASAFDPDEVLFTLPLTLTLGWPAVVIVLIVVDTFLGGPRKQKCFRPIHITHLELFISLIIIYFCNSVKDVNNLTCSSYHGKLSYTTATSHM